ncbi:MAG: hypothetical protein JSW40_08605 [Candidatus Omnitrophota bacterium]|nr:MAG: hypothetical protein JSW40_08605 [Candidatus Omnitrophota bacterium]
MRKKYCISFIILASFFLLSVPCFSKEGDKGTLTFTTYYPAPYGVYDELRVRKIAIGDNLYDSSKHSWQEDRGNLAKGDPRIAHDADLVVEGNVGIGTTDPTHNLDARGRLRIDQGPNYDVWIQGGEATSGGGRNLALLGVKARPADGVPEQLRINYGGEYAGGVRIQGPMTRVDGDLGIGVNPTQKLQVYGAIRIGNIPDAKGEKGTIRWNNSLRKFQGHDGTKWVPLGGPSKITHYHFSRPGRAPLNNSKTVNRIKWWYADLGVHDYCMITHTDEQLGEWFGVHPVSQSIPLGSNPPAAELTSPERWHYVVYKGIEDGPDNLPGGGTRGGCVCIDY